MTGEIVFAASSASELTSVQQQGAERSSHESGASPRADETPHVLSPELALIYDAAPVGLAFLSPDCRYVQINQHLTEICGISVADHIGRSVRETVPQVAAQVEALVAAIRRTGEPVIDVEVH